MAGFCLGPIDGDDTKVILDVFRCQCLSDWGSPCQHVRLCLRLGGWTCVRVAFRCSQTWVENSCATYAFPAGFDYGYPRTCPMALWVMAAAVLYNRLLTGHRVSGMREWSRWFYAILHLTLHIHLHTHTYSERERDIHIWFHMCAYIYICTCICTYTHTHMYIYIYIVIYISAYIHCHILNDIICI